MPTVKIAFPNAAGHQLAGYVQLPADRDPRHFALLAHCFSCTKNARALREIARALNQEGFGVMRFDMTGLGESEGAFGEAGFAANIGDIVAAYAYLAEAHRAPALVVGHSLGGTAALCAGAMLPEVRAVVTIGSPSEAGHTTHLFAESLAEIEARGRATVRLQGRPFELSLDFVRSLTEANVAEAIAQSRKALLILHSPQDKTVGIEHAERIYVKARHPKSFGSLDGADHMLTDPGDARYAGQLIAAWVGRYLPRDPDEDAGELGEAKAVAVRLGAEGFTTDIRIRHHGLTADEPPSVGGKDYGPNPYELVTAGLGACTAMTIQMYARRKGWPVERVDVELRHFKDYPADMQAATTYGGSDLGGGGITVGGDDVGGDDAGGDDVGGDDASEAGQAVSPGASAEPPDAKPVKIDHFERVVTLVGDLSEAQRARLLEIADRCPVHRTLEAEVAIVTREG